MSYAMDSNQPISEEAYQFDAFISYRHVEPDKTVAEKLHYLLESYKPPRDILNNTKQPWQGRLFMDRKELPASSNLSDDINEALASSRCLIVICSRRTPESEWVAKEVDTFMQLRGPDSIMTLLIDGEPSEAFPTALLHVTSKRLLPNGLEIEELKEYMAADIRPEEMKRKDGSEGYGLSAAKDRWLLKKSLKNLATEKLRILAPMLGCSYDALKQRHKERILKRSIALALSAALFLFAFGSYMLRQSMALSQANLKLKEQILQTEAEKKRAEANEEEAKYQAEQAEANAQEAQRNMELAKLNEEAALSNLAEANRQKNAVLRNQAFYLAHLSRQQLQNGDRMLAILLALEALPKDIKSPEKPYVEEAYGALASAVNSADHAMTVLKHNDEVRNACFSKDGKYAGTVSADGTVGIWDAKTGEELFKIYSEGVAIYSVQFSPDSKRVVTGAFDGARVWDIKTGKELIRLGSDKVFSAQYSPDGKKIVTDDILWDAFNGKKLQKLQAPADSYGEARFSSDGRYIIRAAREEEKLYCWDTATGKLELELKGHTDYIRSFCFSADGSYIGTASDDKTARIWDAQTGMELLKLKHNYNVMAIDFSPDGKRVVTAGIEGIAYVWDAASGQELMQLKGHTGVLVTAGFSPDGKYIVTTSQDGTARLWSAQNGTELAALSGHKDLVRTAQFSTDSKYVITGSWDNTARIWQADVTDRFLKLTGHKDYIKSAAFSNDAKYIATSSQDNITLVWDTKTGQKLLELAGGAAQFSPDGELVFTYDGAIRLYDVKTGREKSSFKPSGILEKVQFSRDGKILAYFTYGFVQVFDTQSGKLLLEAKNWLKTAAALSPDGKVLASADEKSIHIYEVQTGKKIKSLTEGQTSATALEYSADGKELIVLYKDNTAGIWNVASGKEWSRIGTQVRDIDTAILFHNKKYLLTSSTSSVRLWDTATGKVVDRITNDNGPITKGELSLDGSSIIAYSYSGNGVHIFNSESRNEIMKLKWIQRYPGHLGAEGHPLSFGIRFSSDMAYMLSGTNENNAVLYNLKLDYVVAKAKELLGQRRLTPEERRAFFIE